MIPNILIAVGGAITFAVLWRAIGAEMTIFAAGVAMLIVGLVWKAVNNASE